MAAMNTVISPDSQEYRPAILVVEDEVLIRMAFADYLRDCDFEVLEAGTAAEAIAILKENPSIDLVFSDVRMPGEMDGFGLTQWVRANRAGLPVLLTSGDCRKSEAADKTCPDEPFFAKPYDLEEIVAHIRRAIEAKARDN